MTVGFFVPAVHWPQAAPASGGFPAQRQTAVIARVIEGHQGGTLYGVLWWLGHRAGAEVRGLAQWFVAGPQAHDAARFFRGFLVRARTPAIRSCSA